MQRRLYTGTLAAILAASSLSFGTAGPAEAGARGREKAYRIGTYIGSAATIAALASGKGTLALIGGGATFLSYNQWKKEMRRRHRREQSLAAYRAHRARWLRRHRGRHVVRGR